MDTQIFTDHFLKIFTDINALDYIKNENSETIDSGMGSEDKKEKLRKFFQDYISRNIAYSESQDNKLISETVSFYKDFRTDVSKTSILARNIEYPHMLPELKINMKTYLRIKDIISRPPVVSKASIKALERYKELCRG